MPIISPQDMFKIVHAPDFDVDELSRFNISLHFKWSEVFHSRTLAEVRAAGLSIFQNALSQSARLEKIRLYLCAKLGKEIAMVVSSWYRPPAANANVGGVTGSRHLYALATDFTVPGYAPAYIQALLIPEKDRIGFSLEITNGGWTHVDDRPTHIVFENLGNNQYKTLNVVEMQAHIRKHGKAA